LPNWLRKLSFAGSSGISSQTATARGLVNLVRNLESARRFGAGSSSDDGSPPRYASDILSINGKRASDDHVNGVVLFVLDVLVCSPRPSQAVLPYVPAVLEEHRYRTLPCLHVEERLY
jgi:hypothetical protein